MRQVPVIEQASKDDIIMGIHGFALCGVSVLGQKTHSLA